MANSLNAFYSLSARAARGLWFCITASFLFISPTTSAQNPPTRPRILGIKEVRLFSTDRNAARNFYAHVLGTAEISPNLFSVGPLQSVALFDAPSPLPSSLLAEVVFETDNLRDLAAYLTAQKIPFTQKPTTVQKGDVIGPGYSALSVSDPEGHRISFTTIRRPVPTPVMSTTSTAHIIHSGFIVHDRAAVEHFYRDILGFRPYWHGGMKDDETTWVSLQVPDGTDWLEFMLYDDSQRDKRFRGIMNHIALGVRDIHAVQEQLLKNGAPLTEEPKIGRDGKWQLNVYDPDETRVEFMEYTPVQKPCCSEFTGPHPKP